MRVRALTIAAVIAIAMPLLADGAPLCAASLTGGSESLRSFYPSAALTAHVNGDAELKCRRTEHDVMTDCQQVSESPTGWGFGSAALALAAKSKEAPGATLPPSQRGPRSVHFRFSAEPLCITPDVLETPYMPVSPLFVRHPDVRQVDQALMTARAARNREGSAVLSCRVDDSGLLSGCLVSYESPSHLGFGRAAMLLISYVAVRPTTPDGVPLAGATINIPMNFKVFTSPIGMQ